MSVQAVELLFKAKIYSLENLKDIEKHPRLPLLVRGMMYLLEKKLLSANHFKMIVNHKEPYNLAKTLGLLNDMKMLNTYYSNLISKQIDPEETAKSWLALLKSNLFSAPNLEKINRTLQPNKVYQAISMLQTNGLLNQDNFNLMILHHNPHKLAISFANLEKIHSLTPEFKQRLFTSRYPDYLSIALACLHQSGIVKETNQIRLFACTKLMDISLSLKQLSEEGLLNQVYFDQILAQEENSNQITQALVSLKHSKIFSPEVISLILVHSNPLYLSHNIINLYEAEILTPTLIDMVEKSNNLLNLTHGISFLHQHKLLNTENVIFLLEHQDPFVLAEALINLKKEELLEPKYTSMVVKHSIPYILSVIFSLLKRYELLSDHNLSLIMNLKENVIEIYTILNTLSEASILNIDNLHFILRYENSLNLGAVLNDLQESRILNQENFSRLTQERHASLLTEEAIELIWNHIPQEFLTQDNFQQLLIAAEHADPFQELTRVRDRILARDEVEPRINTYQSTHTTSVHRSVSRSALNLFVNYGHDINFDTEITRIKHYLNGLRINPKHEAVKRCIERITSPTYAFYEPISSISLLQLLALVFSAIHDDTKREGSLEDALELFVEGLYECQRGYNLDASGHDRGNEDSPICAAGTFNKIIEKLQGIHPDVMIEFVTHELASTKFPKLAQSLARNYLDKQCNPVSIKDYRAIKILLAKLDDDTSLAPIWDDIKTEIEDLLWQEFHEAYGDNRQHPQFIALFAYGASINLPELEDLQKKLQCSPGYRAYLASEQSQFEISCFSCFVEQEPQRLESDRPHKKNCLSH